MDAELLDAVMSPGMPLAESGYFGDWVDPRERFWDDTQFFYDGAYGQGPTLAIAPPFSTLNDRAGGQLLPYYRTEQDLALIRGMSRRLRSIHGVSIGALDSLANYVFGSTGFVWKVKSADKMEKQVPAGLKETAQKLIDRFVDNNDVCGELDRDIHGASREDGESFAVLNRTANGVDLELLEPDQIKEPLNPVALYDWMRDEHGVDCDTFVPCWRFGVLTHQHQTHRPIAYHVVRDSAGFDWDMVPAARMVHFKRNVTRNAKRGVSDFFPILEDCSNEIKLARNTSLGAALQASIPWIEEFPAGTTQAQVSGFSSGQADLQFQQKKAAGSEQINARRYRPGTIVRTSPGRKFQPGPMGSERSANFIEVAGYVLRRIGVRWVFPEYMISADASNANFASTLVAESPFVKARQADQHWFSRRFRNMAWKVLYLEYQSGAFSRFGLQWAEIQLLLDIDVEAPEVASRDTYQKAQEDQILVGIGAKSVETVQIENGLDPETERKRGAKPAAVPMIGEDRLPRPDATVKTPEEKPPYQGPHARPDEEGLQESLVESFDESKHPRDDRGEFVTTGEIQAARSDTHKAAELRSKVTNPVERQKLDVMLDPKEKTVAEHAAEVAHHAKQIADAVALIPSKIASAIDAASEGMIKASRKLPGQLGVHESQDQYTGRAALAASLSECAELPESTRAVLRDFCTQQDT